MTLPAGRIRVSSRLGILSGRRIERAMVSTDGALGRPEPPVRWGVGGRPLGSEGVFAPGPVPTLRGRWADPTNPHWASETPLRDTGDSEVYT